MPELPDITLYIEAFRQRLRGQRLGRSLIRSPFLLRSVAPPLDATHGAKVAAFERLGKRIDRFRQRRLARASPHDRGPPAVARGLACFADAADGACARIRERHAAAHG